MANDSWLEQELAELDEAEQFIQQTMSNFVPTSANTGNASGSTKTGVSKGSNSSQVTRSMPKAETDVDKLTNQLIEGLDTGKHKDSGHYDNFNLPPPPDLDDFVISPKEEKKPKSPDLPPPPPSINTYPAPVKPNNPPVMSKPAPPPVLPKPSRSTALQGPRTGIGNITIQLNRPSSNPPAVASKPYSAPPAFQPPPPVVDSPLPPKPTPAPALASGIPKEIKKNSAEELDFLTNNLLSNMENPKDEDFYGYCEKCNGVVEGEKVGCNALDHIYHIKCFTCATCNNPLHGEPFFAVENKPYCEGCYIASLEKCTVCSQTITDRILRATGKPYHPQCFKCTVCGKSLDGIPFTLDDESKVYCVDDYHQKYAPRCSVCQLPILPEPGKEETVRIIALERSFHVKCYKCENCQIQFSADQGCYPLDNHVFCQDCNTFMVQQLSA